MNGARFIGTNDQFIVYFKSGAPDLRAENSGTQYWLTGDDARSDFSERIYCYALMDQMSNADFMDAQLLRSPLDKTYEEDFSGNMYVKLCPGDRGYIQMNKQKPQNDDEAGEDWGGSAHNFAFIQMTQKGEC